MKVKTIIWDLDGTLLDTLADLKDSVNRTLTRYQLPTRTQEEIRSFVGNGVVRLLELAVPQGKDHPHFAEIYAAFREDYAENFNVKTRPFPGILELLEKLKNKGYQMAIVSNKVDAEVKKLANLYFQGLIDYAIGENEAAGLKKKPDPDMIFEAVKQMNTAVEDSVYIGDSEVDIATANNASMACIAVSWGFRSIEELKKANAQKIAQDIEMLELMLLGSFK